VGFLLLVAALTGSRAVAQEAPRPDEREVKARQLFGIGKYAEALDIYGELYAETTHPTYLRNIGRCYQNLGQPEKAISSFQEYLRQVRNLPADQRAVVDGYIREMEALKSKQEEEKKPPVVTPEDAPPPAQEAPPAPGATLTSSSPPPAEKRGTSNTAAYVTAGVSLAALAVGGYFGVRAIMKDRAADPLCPMDRCNDEGWRLNEEAKTAARVADVALGAGLVAAGVAAYLFISSPSTSAKPETVSGRLRVHPQLGPSAAGLVLGASW
jgi:tetratricopeptide (TPR) repeat protein